MALSIESGQRPVELIVTGRVAVIGEIDLILIMSVEPGYGGQKFIQNIIPKIEKTRELLGEDNSIYLSVDGGVNNKNISLIKVSGADVVVAGSYIFKSNNYRHAIQNLKK